VIQAGTVTDSVALGYEDLFQDRLHSHGFCEQEGPGKVMVKNRNWGLEMWLKWYEHLLCKREVLSSSPSPTKKKKKIGIGHALFFVHQLQS
jgi:hypothetical protein